MREIIKKYLECHEVIHKLCMEIWNYIFDNYADCLEFGENSRLYNWEINVEELNFEYYNFKGEYRTEFIEDIPLEAVYNNTWKEYIDQLFKNANTIN